jgi:hypothetical protein
MLGGLLAVAALATSAIAAEHVTASPRGADKRDDSGSTINNTGGNGVTFNSGGNGVGDTTIVISGDNTDHGPSATVVVNSGTQKGTISVTATNNPASSATNTQSGGAPAATTSKSAAAAASIGRGGIGMGAGIFGLTSAVVGLVNGAAIIVAAVL